MRHYFIAADASNIREDANLIFFSLYPAIISIKLLPLHVQKELSRLHDEQKNSHRHIAGIQ